MGNYRQMERQYLSKEFYNQKRPNAGKGRGEGRRTKIAVHILINCFVFLFDFKSVQKGTLHTGVWDRWNIMGMEKQRKEDKNRSIRRRYEKHYTENYCLRKGKKASSEKNGEA